MVDKSALWNFVSALRQHWFAAMSGGFSVPFTAAMVYANSKYTQAIFAALALASLWFAAYRIWKSEHDKVLHLQESAGAVRTREIEAQERHADELRRHTDALEREARTTKNLLRTPPTTRIREIVREAKAQEPLPDWPIHNLFTYVRPDLLTRDDSHVGDEWDRIGAEVLDKASIGELKIWGRTIPSGVDGILGQRPALRLIKPSYWENAFFTYSFFDSTAGDVPHTYLKYGHNDEIYTDLRVNHMDSTMIFWEMKENEKKV